MSHRFTASDGVAIAFQRWGESSPGPVVVLHHGFAASASSNWEAPGVVQAFVDASAIGWYNYLYHDNKAANELIKKHNPEMNDAMLAYSVAKMKEFGIVDSGDTLKSGIGAMTDARMHAFYDKMVRTGVVKAGLDYRKAFTLKFVNKGVGLNLRPK